MTHRNGTEVARDTEGVRKRGMSYLEADTRTSRSAFGMRSPRIVPWEVLIASAAGPTPALPLGVVRIQPCLSCSLL